MCLNYFNPFKKLISEKLKDVYCYDFDGVVSIGITPRSNKDLIITGRCIDEKHKVLDILKERGISCKVYFNPMTLKERGNHTLKARRYSGNHKAKTITKLKESGVNITRFFEDDPVQIKCILREHKDLDIIHIKSELVER